jgi:hypothetical protein
LDDSNGWIMFLLYTGAVLQLCTNQARGMGCALWGSSSFDNSSNLAPAALDIEMEVLRLLLSCVRSLGAMLTLILLRKWVANEVPDVFLGTRSRHHHNEQQVWMVRDLFLHLQCRLLVCSVLSFTPASVPTSLVDLTVLAMSTCSQQVFSFPPSVSSIASIAATIPVR